MSEDLPPHQAQKQHVDGAHLLRGFAEGAPMPVLRIAKQVAQEAECCVWLHPLPVVFEPLLKRARLCTQKEPGLVLSMRE